MSADQLFPKLNSAGDTLALRFPDGELSWRELAHRCRGHIAWLRTQGIEPGDRVAITAESTLSAAVAIVANLVAGVVTVPLNPKLGEGERAHILSDSSPKLVIDRPLAATDGPVLPSGEIMGRPAFIIYTSGTTGPPKGAVLSDRNIAACLDGLIRAWRWSDRDVVVHGLPMFHVHGLVLGLLGSLRVGGTMWSIGRFDPQAIADALDGAATMLFAVPTMYHRLALEAGANQRLCRGLARARMLISGSAPLARPDARSLRELAGVSVYQRYGLTETLINSASRYDVDFDEAKVGVPLHGVDLKIVDEQRRDLSANEIGEIAVRGDHVFIGYLNNDRATNAVRDSEGWFYTGDVGTVDDDGLVTIVGRRSTDLIKTGGYKVGAGEVEARLLEHEGVAEVAVVGIEDADLGQRIEAVVVAVDSMVPPEELDDWVAMGLSPHKRPRRVHFRDRLPRNAMGKVQKKKLIRELED